MYSGGSVASKASTIGIGILPTPPLIFTGGQKVQNLASFLTSLKFQLPAFENAVRYPNSETNFLCSHGHPMSSPSLVKLGPCTPENHSAKMPHDEDVLNR